MAGIDFQIVPLAVLAAIPVLGLVFVARYYLKKVLKPSNAYDPVTGIGRGAPGFNTTKKTVQLPAYIVARIKMGEEVTGEEITEALEQVKRDEEARQELLMASVRREEEMKKRGIKIGKNVDLDFLPPSISSSKVRKRQK